MFGAITASLEANKSNYIVGDTPTYIVRAAIPGSRVLWTSFKNGEATGEYNADYGHVVGANGTVELVAGGPWTPAEVGTWQKQALIIAPDGGQSLVQTVFRVSEAAPASAPPGQSPLPVSRDFWREPFFSIGDFEVTPVIAAVAFGALYLFTKKR